MMFDRFLFDFWEVPKMSKKYWNMSGSLNQPSWNNSSPQKLQRHFKKNNKLSSERITKLELLQGWIWEFDYYDEVWNTNYELLKQYMLDNWELFPNTKHNPYPFEVSWSEKELLDVDTETDFKIVEEFIK